MLESARIATAHCAGSQQADLGHGHLFTDALERRVSIIGEAARKLSDTFKSAHPEVPWTAITATRHILVHEYDRVNYATVWRIVHQHLPPLIEPLATILGGNPPPAIVQP